MTMKVGLFIPCYINAVYPQVGIASYKLLKSLGVDVDYPLNQTCCGQPMANAGFENKAVDLARHFDEQFKNYDYIVGPSASCVVFVRDNYSRLLKEDKHRCASEGKIYDICEFIHDIVKPSSLKAKFPHKVSLQNSCHGVRLMKLSSASELNIPYFSKLRDLLSLVEGVEVVEPERKDECCGFGGKAAVGVHGDDHGDHHAHVALRALVEILGELADVHAVLTQSRANRGRRSGLAGRDLETDIANNFLCQVKAPLS